MNDHVRPCNSKPQQRDLTPVLHRPVELATKSGQILQRNEMTLSATSGLMHCNLIGETLGVLDDLHRLRRLNITKTGRARISISSAGLARPRRLPLASLPAAAKSP